MDIRINFPTFRWYALVSAAWIFVGFGLGRLDPVIVHHEQRTITTQLSSLRSPVPVAAKLRFPLDGDSATIGIDGGTCTVGQIYTQTDASARWACSNSNAIWENSTKSALLRWWDKAKRLFSKN